MMHEYEVVIRGEFCCIPASDELTATDLIYFAISEWERINGWNFKGTIIVRKQSEA